MLDFKSLKYYHLDTGIQITLRVEKYPITDSEDDDSRNDFISDLPDYYEPQQLCK